MATCSQHKLNTSSWQAVTFVFIKHFKEKLILATNRTDCTHVQPPKHLTTEALFMIFVVTILIICAVLGTLNTTFEFFYAKDTERKKIIKNSEKFSNTLPKNVKRKTSDSDGSNEDYTKIMKGDTKNFIFYQKDWFRKSRSFLRCFCFVTNGKKLFQVDPDKIQFECFHGIRVICNLIVISNHVFMFYIITTRSMDTFQPLMKTPTYKLLSNTPFGVDAFFLLSAFLNAYSFSKLYEKNNGKICWWTFYLKRFLRITPAYMIVLGFYTTLLSYMGSGPIWPEYTTNQVCKENWWWYLLYINNFELCLNSCMVWCWHLAADMQVYVVSPVFLLSLLRWKRFGYILASLTIFLAGLYSFQITKQYNLTHSNFVKLYLLVDDSETFFDKFPMYVDKLYNKPFSRISNYLIGLLLGYYFYEKNSKDIRNRWITLCLGWIVTGFLIWISFFALLSREDSLLEVALHNSVKHLFFSVGLSWIIFVCLTKQASFVNAFLSCKLFFPLSKLSYCACLIHVLLIQRDYQASHVLEEFSILSLVFYFFRVYIWTFALSIPGSLLFEIPFINLFDLYMKKAKTEKQKGRKEKIKKN